MLFAFLVALVGMALPLCVIYSSLKERRYNREPGFWFRCAIAVLSAAVVVQIYFAFVAAYIVYPGCLKFKELITNAPAFLT